MNFRRLRRDLEALRRRVGQIRPRELESLAKKLGRKRSKRGVEPNWISTRPGHFPISNPSHPGTLAPGTARNILNALEADLETLEAEAERN